jgi:hypothetical protein
MTKKERYVCSSICFVWIPSLTAVLICLRFDSHGFVLPSCLSRCVQDDFTDPKFLSITNPRWTRLGLDPKVIDILSEKGITKFTPGSGPRHSFLSSLAVT